MTTSITPPSAFLPSCPVSLPTHEPRKSSVTPYYYLSDKQPDDAEGHSSENLFPFPQGKVMKWLSSKEIITEVISMGYDMDIAQWVPHYMDGYNFGKLHAYYIHKDQARRNKKKALARKLAEQLVGTQTPPSDETPTPQE